MKLDFKYRSALTAVSMAVTMSLLMGLTLTLVNVGWGPKFWSSWWHSVWIANLVGIPASVLLSPPIARLAGWLTPAKGPAAA
ncbi:DUF2798 domain-containing protein [uncultured Hymenobacter sp.]|uniref:DUF2798 domain-containing protein n=1 Tax=uncultured Hymenobacter sp. TaxID=170016 RepID=UPI0035CA908E